MDQAPTSAGWPSFSGCNGNNGECGSLLIEARHTSIQAALCSAQTRSCRRANATGSLSKARRVLVELLRPNVQRLGHTLDTQPFDRLGLTVARRRQRARQGILLRIDHRPDEAVVQRVLTVFMGVLVSRQQAPVADCIPQGSGTGFSSRDFRPRPTRLEITDTGIDSINEPTIGTSHHRKLGFSQMTSRAQKKPSKVCGP